MVEVTIVAGMMEFVTSLTTHYAPSTHKCLPHVLGSRYVLVVTKLLL